MKSTNLIPILFTALALSACGENKSDNNKVTAIPQEDVLTSNQWCSLERIELNLNPSIMTRYTFKKGFEKNSVRVEYIRITDEGKTVTYNQKKDYVWFEYNGDRSLSFDSFSVEIRKDPPRSISISNQQYRRNQLSKNHPSLVGLNSEADFKPSYEVSLKNLTFMSGNDSEQLFYPCNSFGKAFGTTGAVHSIVEFQIYLGQLFAKVDSSRNSLASFRALKLPIKEISTSELISKNESWCAQFELGSNWSELNVLTFSNNKYVSTKLSDDWLSSPERQDLFNSVIENSLERANVYSILENDQRLKGQFKTDITTRITTSKGEQTSPFYFNDLYVAVEDAEGIQALVKVNAYNPENTGSIPFRDTFFKCLTEKKDNHYFQTNLKFLIEAQKSLLLK